MVLLLQLNGELCGRFGALSEGRCCFLGVVWWSVSRRLSGFFCHCLIVTIFRVRVFKKWKIEARTRIVFTKISMYFVTVLFSLIETFVYHEQKKSLKI